MRDQNPRWLPYSFCTLSARARELCPFSTLYLLSTVYVPSLVCSRPKPMPNTSLALWLPVSSRSPPIIHLGLLSSPDFVKPYITPPKEVKNIINTNTISTIKTNPGCFLTYSFDQLIAAVNILLNIK